MTGINRLNKTLFIRLDLKFHGNVCSMVKRLPDAASYRYKYRFNSIYLILLMGLIFTGCLEPNREEIWQLERVVTANTIGYCRDIFMAGDTAFVAAGQAGVEAWDLAGFFQDGSLPQLLTRIDSISPIQDFKDIAQVYFLSRKNILFIVEYNTDIEHIDVTDLSSPVFLGRLLQNRETREIRVIDDIDRFTIYIADNNDGLKWNHYEYDEGYQIWVPGAGGEIPVTGKATGIDIYGDRLALTIGQMGVQLYQLNDITSSPERIGTFDTAGNARRVTFFDSSIVYVASDGGGAYRIPLSVIKKGTGEALQFGDGLKVKHVAVKDHRVVLSCGSTGIALYDMSDPSHPESKGIYDIGYVYSTVFTEEYLLAATREGMQIFRIIE